MLLKTKKNNMCKFITKIVKFWKSLMTDNTVSCSRCVHQHAMSCLCSDKCYSTADNSFFQKKTKC